VLIKEEFDGEECEAELSFFSGRTLLQLVEVVVELV